MGAVDSNELAQVRAILAANVRRLRFPGPLEALFRERHEQDVLEGMRHGALWLVVAYVFAGLFQGGIIWRLSPPELLVHDLVVWAVGFWTITLALGAVLLASWRSSWQPYFDAVNASACFVAVLTIMLCGWNLDYAPIAGLAGYLILLVVLAVYGFSRLRFLMSVVVVQSATLLALMLAAMMSRFPPFLEFTQYFGMASLLGLLLCWQMEYRDRRLFLQGRLLELEKEAIAQESQHLDAVTRVDAATGLMHDRYFTELLLREWERSRREQQPLSLLVIDIDLFKQYRLQYGYLAGERCLPAIAQQIQGSLKRASDIATRHSDDVFMVLLPNTPATGAQGVAEAILHAVDALQICHEKSVYEGIMTVSIGIATRMPKGLGDAAELIAEASSAAEEAKQQGRHRWMQLNHASAAVEIRP